jgi:hypothetical protein
MTSPLAHLTPTLVTLTAKFGRCGLREGEHPNALVRNDSWSAEVVRLNRGGLRGDLEVVAVMILQETWLDLIDFTGWTWIGTAPRSNQIEEWHCCPVDDARAW